MNNISTSGGLMVIITSLPQDECLNKIKPSLRNIIIYFQNSGTLKIQLTIEINFVFSKDTEKENVMHSRTHSIKFTFYNDANELVDELFDSLHLRYQGNLETSTKGSDFIFDSVQLIFYKCHKISFKHGGSYVDSPEWIKKKKATIYRKNSGDKCFQYGVTVALTYREIKWNPERVSNLKAFISKYN